ncbi:MAG: ATP-binding protein [Pseudomonadota bacterium]
MRIPRPKSLNGLLVLGFVLVSLPLILAIVRAATQLNEFATESEALVIQGVQDTDQNQSLRKELSSMERSARVYQVIGEVELLATYEERLDKVRATLDQIATDSADATRNEQIRALQRRLSAFDTTIRSAERDSTEVNNALNNLSELRDMVDDMSRDSNRFIDSGLSELRESAREVQRQLAIQTALLVPFTLIVVVIFTGLLARPLRQIDTAISTLGDGQFSSPIEVSGPEDLEALGRQLEWLRERLQEQEREKDKFLRHMSHELKTPLANIREGTELLIDGAVGDLKPAQIEVTDILRENSLSLQKLIENLLSFSAWQSQLSDLHLEEFELAPLIQSVVDQQRLTLASRHLKVKGKLASLTVLADAAKLRMVVDNLLTNAIKFSPDGGIIRLITRASGDGYVIEISDEGPGVPATEQARIFEPFYQGSTAQAGHVKGTGIGLSVVLECINAHGGKISMIDSKRGAHFQISLPKIPVTATGS